MRTRLDRRQRAHVQRAVIVTVFDSSLQTSSLFVRQWRLPHSYNLPSSTKSRICLQLIFFIQTSLNRSCDILCYIYIYIYKYINTYIYICIYAHHTLSQSALFCRHHLIKVIMDNLLQILPSSIR